MQSKKMGGNEIQGPHGRWPFPRRNLLHLLTSLLSGTTPHPSCNSWMNHPGNGSKMLPNGGPKTLFTLLLQSPLWRELGIELHFSFSRSPNYRPITEQQWAWLISPTNQVLLRGSYMCQSTRKRRLPLSSENRVWQSPLLKETWAHVWSEIRA